MSVLKLTLFGPPRLERDGQPVEVSRRKALAMLAYLAATGQVHSRDTLATLFWPEVDQRRARGNLRRALSDLNQELGEGILLLEGETVALAGDNGVWSDVAQFRACLTACESHNHTPDEICPDCLPLLAEAAGLYQANFLAGFSLRDAAAFDDWQYFEAEGLRQALASVLERLAQAHSNQGDYEAAIPYTRRWLALDPLHEPAQQVLMQLYHLSGQSVAALRQYELYAELLDEELGLPPGEEMITLYEAIKANQKLGPYLKKVPTPGSKAAENIPVVGGASPQHNLPAQTTRFIGRKAEQNTLLALLLKKETRLVTITGAGGMGKTRLALAVAAQLSQQNNPKFADGTYFVELAALNSAHLITATIAKTLGIRTEQSETSLHNFLQSKQMLLVLDNFEHLLAGAATIEKLLQQAPQLTILTTSRERLRLQEEQLLPIWGLSTPNNVQRESESTALFLNSARRIQPNLEPDEGEWDAIGHICRLVAGMPLAIELAAAWIDTLAPHEIADEIERNLDFLETELVNVPDRHRSVRAAIDTSWRQLSGEQQQQFAKLSIFRGGFSREAAQKIAGIPLRVLSHFTNKSLLAFQRDSQRYDMHEMLRQFSAEQLTRDAPLHQQTAADHAAHFGNILGDWGWFTPDQQMEDTFNAISRDIDNVRVAWQRLAATQQFNIIQRGYVSLTRYYLRCGSLLEGIHLLAEALQKLPTTQQELQARLMIAQARLWGMQGDYEAAIAAAEQTIAIGTAVQNKRVVAAALFEWSVVLWLMGQFDLCRQKLDAALPLAREESIPLLEADILRHLGLISWKKGGFEEAESCFEQALALFRHHHSLEGEAHTLNNLGLLAPWRNQLPESLAYFKQSVSIYNRIGDRTGAGRALTNQANLEWMLGDAVGAIEHAKESLLIHRQADIQRGVAVTLAWLGVYHTGLGLLDAAQRYIEQGVALCKKIGAQHDLINLLNKKSQWALQTADYQTAYEVAQEALAMSYQFDVTLNQDSLMCCCGRALCEMEQYAAAGDAYGDALQLLRERNLIPRTIEPLAGLARIALATGNLSQAMAYCDDILPMLTSHDNAIFDPFHVDLTCYYILNAAADPRAAAVQRNAVDRLQARAQQIYDYTLRRSFLEAVPTHRALLSLKAVE